jgi:ketosteroid isomerase-like protein
MSKEKTMTKDQASNLANHWVAAWNAHDLDAIMTHNDEGIELTSPAAAQLLGTPDGKVIGKQNLRACFQRGLKAYPELHFHLEDVLSGLNSVGLYYTNKKGPTPPSSWNSPHTERSSASSPTTASRVGGTNLRTNLPPKK